MHRSSENIGTIAAALAKAQLELTNPAKSLVGTLPGMTPNGVGAFAMRRCRAGSTSCAKASAGMRSPPSKQRLSMKAPGSCG